MHHHSPHETLYIVVVLALGLLIGGLNFKYKLIKSRSKSKYPRFRKMCIEAILIVSTLFCAKYIGFNAIAATLASVTFVLVSIGIDDIRRSKDS